MQIRAGQARLLHDEVAAVCRAQVHHARLWLRYTELHGGAETVLQAH